MKSIETLIGCGPLQQVRRVYISFVDYLLLIESMIHPICFCFHLVQLLDLNRVSLSTKIICIRKICLAQRYCNRTAVGFAYS